MRTSRTGLWLLGLSLLASVIYAQGGFTDAFGPSGERGRQPVADPGANAKLEVELAPEATELGAGDTFRVEVVVDGDPLVSANNVEVELRVQVRRGAVHAPAGQDLRFGSFFRKAADSEAEITCTGEGELRTCPVGSIGSGARATISATLRTNPKAQPGEIVVIARALIGGTLVDSEQVVIQLVEKPTLSKAGLTLEIVAESDLGAPGEDIDQAIVVSNTSNQEDATEVVVTIQQRLVSLEQSGVRRLGDEEFATVVRDVICRTGEQTFQCALGSLAPGAERRIPIQTSIRTELPPRGRAALETRARVRCKERDPKPGDNVAKSSVSVISRQPELAFLSEVTNARGLRDFARAQSIVPGQVFWIAARYANVLVDPVENDLTVTLHVPNAQPATVQLRRSTVAGERVFRSAPFILLSPGDQNDPENKTPIRATRGSFLRITRGTGKAEAQVR